MKTHCCDPRRLEVLARFGSANAIAAIEVRDHQEPVAALRQRTLFVHLLRPGFALAAEQVVIDGGARIAEVPIEWIAAADALPAGADPSLADGLDDPSTVLVVRTAIAGDFSRYDLRLRAAAGSEQPPPGFDPRLSSISFSFKVECPSDYDCATGPRCPPAPATAPVIDYLAKDYDGFRRLMLDRMSLLVPGWQERSAADAGIAIVELMAYAADHLSYRQDAIATEAYLGTARRRVSVRRHARLVDYRLHDGCNARVFVQVAVAVDWLLPRGTGLLSGVNADGDPALLPDSLPWRDAISAGASSFETAHDAALVAAHNELPLYGWGEVGCCLARGATRATLRGAWPKLAAGQFLAFEERLSPTTYQAGDADRDKRWVVRLTEVKVGVDPSGQLFDELPADGPVAITEIAWDAADALPFPLCLSVAARPGLAISVALGNIVLADHGRSIRDEDLGTVPAPRLQRVPAAAGGDCQCEPAEPQPIPARYRPQLRESPVTQGYALAEELAAAGAAWPASRLLRRDPHEALPQVPGLRATPPAPALPGPPWTARLDLLDSPPEASDFVVETDDDGRAALRFGDDRHGLRPNPGTRFRASYRVGNGSAGNVGADSIGRIVSSDAGVFTAIRNPLAAAGGVDPETLDEARRDAPEAFRTQERAVTAADYAAAAERRAEVQRAAASFRWTGSWHTVFVSADRVGGGAVDAPFASRLRRHLEPFRMAGYDLAVDAPRYVALDIALHVCVLPDYFRADVLAAVRAALGSGLLADGRPGLFHPDRFSFGQPVYLSPVIAAAQAVPGVASVTAKRFARLGQPDPVPLSTGVIPLGRLEIAQLANDPNFRERGRLLLTAGGGK